MDVDFDADARLRTPDAHVLLLGMESRSTPSYALSCCIPLMPRQCARAFARSHLRVTEVSSGLVTDQDYGITEKNSSRNKNNRVNALTPRKCPKDLDLIDRKFTHHYIQSHEHVPTRSREKKSKPGTRIGEYHLSLSEWILISACIFVNSVRI